MIRLVELGLNAQNRLQKYNEYGRGVSFVMKELKEYKVYDGEYKECIEYFTNKINLATVNMINYSDDKELLQLHIGMLAFYNAIIQELMTEKY